MIDRINLLNDDTSRFLIRNLGEDEWYLCVDSIYPMRGYQVIRKLNEFENLFINSAINATTQEAWTWAGGNPQIPATLDELRFALETLDQIAEEADDSNNPLLVFAKEILIGAYKPEELTSAAMQAIEHFRKSK